MSTHLGIVVYGQVGDKHGHASPGIALGVWAQRVEALLVDGRALALEQRHYRVHAQRLLHHHVQVLHARNQFIAQALPRRGKCVTYFATQSLLHQGLLGQLVQGKGHGGGAGLDACHLEAGRLGGQKVLMMRKVGLILLQIGLLLECDQHFNEIIAQYAAPFALLDHQLDDAAQELGMRLCEQPGTHQRHQLGQKEYHKEVEYAPHIRTEDLLTM